MFGIEGRELTQLLDHFLGDELRGAVLRSTMHHAMPHRSQRDPPEALLDPIHQRAHRRRVVRRSQRPEKLSAWSSLSPARWPQAVQSALRCPP